MIAKPQGLVTHVRTLPASAGWSWLREGLALYWRQPFAFTALVILYTMALMLLSNVPVVGLPIAAVLVPFGTVGLTLAGRVAEKGGMPLPALLLDGFREGPQRSPLLRLGFLHAALVLALVLVASVFAIDELRNWKVSDGQLDPASVSQNIPWDALVVSVLLYTPVLMLTWFAPQLVAWHRQPVSKALFFSFFACWRNKWPFLVLGLVLMALSLGVGYLTTELLRALGLSPQMMSMLFAPVAMVVTSITYATQYPIYRAIIEPQAEVPPALPPQEPAPPDAGS
ncbi:MAG: BPSS1780 family membrane protein [Burkholderiaceae bacterium]